MIKMSFFDGTLNRKTVEDFILKSDKPIRFTHGLGYRHPTTYKVLINKDKALEIVRNSYNLLDVTEYEDFLHLNTFSTNDMW